MEAARRHKGLLMLALLAGTAAAALLRPVRGLGQPLAGRGSRRPAGPGPGSERLHRTVCPPAPDAGRPGVRLCPGGGGRHHPGVLGNPLAGPNIIGGQRRGGAGSHFVLRPAARLHDGGAGGGLRGALCACVLVYTLARRTGASRITPGAGRCGHQQHPVRRHRRGLHPSFRRLPWGPTPLWWGGWPE